MDWRRTLTQIYADRSADEPRPEFRPGVSAEEIAAAEQRLDVLFPSGLRTLLQETNGVMERMQLGDEVVDVQWLHWPLDEIVVWNERYRAHTAKSNYSGEAHPVLFFANAGVDGIQFGFSIDQDRQCRSNVVVWHPYDDEITDVAPSLEDFLRGWLNGEIGV